MEGSQERSRLLGEMFVEKGLLTEAELEDVLVEQARTGRRIGQIVVARGLISGPALTTVLSEQLGVELETEHGFGSGLWSQIARRHERGLGLAVESLAGNHLTGDAEEIRARAEEPAEEPTLEELARQLGALEARLGTERATREQVENELAQARRELAELAGGEPTSGFLIYVSLEGGFALLERDGEPPEPGGRIAVPGFGRRRFVVDAIARSPLPLDGRPCAYLHAAPTSRSGSRRGDKASGSDRSVR